MRLESDRFWSKVDKSGPVPEHMPHLGPCWVWVASKATDGYGHVRHNRKFCPAHRVAFEFAVGPIPTGMLVCHHCDNKSCCNPAHLFLGTAEDNMRDMERKGRAVRNHLRGTSNGAAKLTEDQVRQIRKLYVSRKNSAQLARVFSVDRRTVLRVVARQVWGHVS